MYIAEHCPPLKIEALRMALAYVMTTYNTTMYQTVHKKLQDAVSRYFQISENYILTIFSHNGMLHMIKLYCLFPFQSNDIFLRIISERFSKPLGYIGCQGPLKSGLFCNLFVICELSFQFLYFTGCSSRCCSQRTSTWFSVDRNHGQKSGYEIREAWHRSKELQE